MVGAYKPPAVNYGDMDASDVRTNLEAEYETELSRLGSSKAVYALTEGEMEAAVVIGRLADRAHTAAETFDEWAADTPDTVLSDIFGAVGELQREHASELADARNGTVSESVTAFESSLRDLVTPVERAGGLLAWALVTDQTYSQAVGFFVGNADPSGADRFRELRTDIEAELDRIESLLETACSDDADWAAAEAAAGDSIEAAYDTYVETLESLGVKVKPVC